MPQMRRRLDASFIALVGIQAAHSVEEYLGRLYEVFPPAPSVSGLLSQDLRRGFIIGNIVLVTFGVWCFFWPIRRRWHTAMAIGWFWVTIELVNGVVHPLVTARAAPHTVWPRLRCCSYCAVFGAAAPCPNQAAA
jgi:hypothetical protein